MIAYPQKLEKKSHGYNFNKSSLQLVLQRRDWVYSKCRIALIKNTNDMANRRFVWSQRRSRVLSLNQDVTVWQKSMAKLMIWKAQRRS